MSKETQEILEQISANIRFNSEKSKFSSVLFYFPYYCMDQQLQYQYQFDLEVFQQKEIPKLTIQISSVIEVKQSIIDWQVAALKTFQFKTLVIYAYSLCNHLKRIFDLQPSIEEIQIFYFNSHDLKYISDFLSCQDKIKNLKTLQLSLSPINNEQSNFKRSIPRFIAENIDSLDNLHLVLDVRSLYFTIRQILASSKKEFIANHLQEISLNFQPLTINQQDSFQEEEQSLDDDNFLFNFFKRIQGIKKFALYFAQSIYNQKIYNSLCDIIQFQLECNQLQQLILCFSQVRVQFDLLPIIENISKFSELKKLELILNFSTQVVMTKPSEIIKLESIEDLSLNLAYCPCSHNIIEYICFKNLSKLKINLNFIKNPDQQTQNINNITNWIQENKSIESVEINILNSEQADMETYQDLFNAVKCKQGTLQFLKLVGFPEIFLNENNLEIIQYISNIDISFDNYHRVLKQNNSISILNSNSDFFTPICIVKSILEYSKSFLRHFKFNINLGFQNEQISDQEKIQEVIDLISPYKKLNSINLGFRSTFQLNRECIDKIIKSLFDFENLQSYIILTDTVKILSKDQMSALIQLIGEKLSLNHIYFNHFTLPTQNICLQRGKLFKRVIKSIQYYKQSKVTNIFRHDIIKELLGISYQVPCQTN